MSEPQTEELIRWLLDLELDDETIVWVMVEEWKKSQHCQVNY